MNIFNTNYFTEDYFKKAGKTVLYLAIFEIILAILVFVFPIFGTEVLVYTVAFALLFGGISRFVAVFTVSNGIGFKILQAILGILYIIVAVDFFINVGEAVLTLTLFLGLLLLFEGFVLLFSASSVPAKGLTIFNGIITIILGALILFQYPNSALIVPFYFGFSLLFNGITIIVAYNTLKKQLNNPNNNNTDQM